MQNVSLRSKSFGLAIVVMTVAIAGLSPHTHASKENLRVLERWGGDLAIWKVSTRYHVAMRGEMSRADRTVDPSDPSADYRAYFSWRTGFATAEGSFGE